MEFEIFSNERSLLSWLWSQDGRIRSTQRRPRSWYVACRDFTALFCCGSGVKTEESGLAKTGCGSKCLWELCVLFCLGSGVKTEDPSCLFGRRPSLVARRLPGLHSTLLLWLWSQDRRVRTLLNRERGFLKRCAAVETWPAYSSVLAPKSRQKCQDLPNQGHGS